MNARFGVEFADPVDEYRMADRSVKYAVLLTRTEPSRGT